MSLLARQLCCRLACQGGKRSLATTHCLKAAKADKADQMTHTGQQFSESDPRNVRFAVTGLEKQVNNQWAIDLIKEVPPIAVNKRIVSLVLLCLTELTVVTFRSPVTEVVELKATLESTSTSTMVNPCPASTAVSDMSSTRRRDVWKEQ